MPDEAPKRPCSNCHEPMEKVVDGAKLGDQGFPPVYTWTCRNSACPREGELVLVQGEFRTGKS